MKKLIVLMMMAYVPVFLQAQGTPLSSLYDKYVAEPGFETTEILPGSVSFDWEKSIENTPVKEMMQNITSIRILKYKSDKGSTDQEKLWRKMQKTAGDKLYTEVMTIFADKVQVYIYYIKGPEGKTRELAMLERDNNGIMMLTVTGDMDFSGMFSAENMQSLREAGKYFLENKSGCSAKEDPND
jgi:hypothetical protein